MRNPHLTIQELAPRHQFNANWIYELPFGGGKAFAPQSAIWRKVLEGWQTTGLIKFRTGRPLSIRSGEVFNLTNTPNFDTPNLDISDDDLVFGQILDTITNPRQMQFALKINF